MRDEMRNIFANKLIGENLKNAQNHKTAHHRPGQKSLEQNIKFHERKSSEYKTLNAEMSFSYVYNKQSFDGRKSMKFGIFDKSAVSS